MDLLAPFLPRREVRVTAPSPAISPPMSSSTRTPRGLSMPPPVLADAAQLTRLELEIGVARERNGEGGKRSRRGKSARAAGIGAAGD